MDGFFIHLQILSCYWRYVLIYLERELQTELFPESADE